MPLAVRNDPPPLRTDQEGVVRVGESRVMLELVIHAFDDGASAEEIAARYPSLQLADVHATLAYILRHRDEIDAYMADSAAAIEETRKTMRERSPQEGLRGELERRLDPPRRD